MKGQSAANEKICKCYSRCEFGTQSQIKQGTVRRSVNIFWGCSGFPGRSGIPVIPDFPVVSAFWSFRLFPDFLVIENKEIL
jgi:hypothetical protein